MSAVAAAIDPLTAEIAERSARLGRPVAVDSRTLDRRGHLDLKPPGAWSPNRACRMVRAADGWITANLSRADDLDLLPAWLETPVGDDPWTAVAATAGGKPWRELIARARLLGLPAAGVGETAGSPLHAPLRRMAAGRGQPIPGPLKVVDLSVMWAGPLCGGVLAAAGAEVVKVESVRRPDPVRHATPAFFASLNGGKSDLALDFADPAAIARLRQAMVCADVVITSARPRAFEALGLSPASIFPLNPGLIWVAVSGYGWAGEAAGWTAFGDDAAAAGGLVRWTPAGAPRFLGDALADPVTGLAAAAGAFAALEDGGGLLVDAGLARCAAGAAALRLAQAA